VAKSPPPAFAPSRRVMSGVKAWFIHHTKADYQYFNAFFTINALE
jgi:hypothetical protein